MVSQAGKSRRKRRKEHPDIDDNHIDLDAPIAQTPNIIGIWRWPEAFSLRTHLVPPENWPKHERRNKLTKKTSTIKEATKKEDSYSWGVPRGQFKLENLIIVEAVLSNVSQSHLRHMRSVREIRWWGLARARNWDADPGQPWVAKAFRDWSGCLSNGWSESIARKMQMLWILWE